MTGHHNNPARADRPGGAPGSDPGPVQRKTTILVVDDERTNLLILEAMLGRLGYEVVTAENGREAIASFERCRPDMVLMDIMMPETDGYEATTAIKKLSGPHYIPIMFLTALSDEQALAKCIEAGGDDFLTKPYNHLILKSKIDALLRTRRLYQELERHKEEIERHHDRLQWEHITADKIFARIVRSGDLDSPNIRYIIRPRSITSGDILLAARTPSGSLHVMLGDFAGHGLSAAIGAIPVSDIFYRLSADGYSIGNIATQINLKLKDALPTGYYCAACLLDLDADCRKISVWNGGLHDVLLCGRNGGIKSRVTSHHLPLGILPPERFEPDIEFIDIERGDRVYIYSDGLVEAGNGHGEMFGRQRLEALLDTDRTGTNGLESVRLALDEFCAGTEQHDDITVLQLTCQPFTGAETRVTTLPRPAQPTRWRSSLHLDAGTLRRLDPLPLLMQSLMGLQELHTHRERIYTVASELFNNALDHGLLRLDASLKRSARGFHEYHRLRTERLSQLDDGWIRIELEHEPRGSGGALTITVENSGSGFDHGDRQWIDPGASSFGGRGIHLVQSLCADLRYDKAGTLASAVYLWHPENPPAMEHHT